MNTATNFGKLTTLGPNGQRTAMCSSHCTENIPGQKALDVFCNTPKIELCNVLEHLLSFECAERQLGRRARWGHD